MTTEFTKTYPATIYIFSEIGHTPLTLRSGSYQDTLAIVKILVTGPADAREKTQELLSTIEHAHYGAYEIPTYWNQNQRRDNMHRDRVAAK